LQRDDSAALAEFFTQQHVVVMQGGDRGSSCIELAAKLRTFARLVSEFSPQSGDFVVLVGLAWSESVTFCDAEIPFVQYSSGSVHGGSAYLGFLPQVFFE
jgi:hypothetical protein